MQAHEKGEAESRTQQSPVIKLHVHASLNCVYSVCVQAHEKEKLNQEHNNRLSATGGRTKLLTESNERLQLHLKERMKVMEEKNQLAQELEQLRQTLDAVQGERVCSSFLFLCLLFYSC